MNSSLTKLLDDLEQDLPEELKTVVTDNTIAAEKQFLKEMRAKVFVEGGHLLSRMHTSWGPRAKDMTQQQLVDYLWEIERAAKIQHAEWNKNDRPQALLTGLSKSRL